MRDELLSLIKKIEIVREAGDALASGAKGLNLFGLADTQKGCFLTALTGLRKNNGPLVFLLPGRACSPYIAARPGSARNRDPYTSATLCAEY